MKISIQVREQRKKHKQGNIRQDRLQRLNDIGFVWDPLGSLWNLRYNQLIEFKSEYGHCRVPQKYNKNPSLGVFVKESIMFLICICSSLLVFVFQGSGSWK